jgi:hypothetical protein
MTMPTTKSVMKHVECTEILADLRVTTGTPRGGVVMLFDSDHNELFKVPVDIDARALLSIVDYGGRQLLRGREQVKIELLTLIGAQPAESRAAS